MKKTILVLVVASLLVAGYAVADRKWGEDKKIRPSKEMREEVKAALEAGDYEAWKALITDKPGKHRVSEVITEENFPQLVEAHTAMKEGNYTLAKELRKELGLGLGHMKKGGCPHLRGRGGGPGVQGKLRDPKVRECMKQCIQDKE